MTGSPAISDTGKSVVVVEKGTDSTIPLPLIITVAAPPNQQSFVLPDISAGVIASSTPSSTPDEQATKEADTGSTSQVSPGETSTPIPTYTPPSSPEPASWEHLWFDRPVPQGSTVWTDKAYPYGTTRGGSLRPHHGVEFNVPANTDVMAVADGTVSISGDDGVQLLGDSTDFYGTVVVIEHNFLFEGQPVYTLYGHLSEIFVEEGQQVKAQDVIARSGSSGVADGAHLHFEVRVGDNDYQSTRNPLLWLYPFPERGVVAGIVAWPDGTPAVEVPLSLRRVDSSSPYMATTTYAIGGVNSDEGIQENFVLDDVAAGYYELIAGTGEEQIKTNLWVYPYQTTFVEIHLDQ